MRTIIEVQNEVREIINRYDNVGDQLEAFKTHGYVLTFTWAKNGDVGSYYYHTHRKIYRIQVSESEIRGSYPAAWFIEFPAILIDKL
jgi:hypothetical protein